MFFDRHTHHIFFIHSLVEGRLGCFLVLVIVGSAAMNIGVRVFFQTAAAAAEFSFFPDI